MVEPSSLGHADRQTPLRARVAVTCKLAVVLHRMWSDQATIRFGKEPGPAVV
jgi:hypothetical protein